MLPAAPSPWTAAGPPSNPGFPEPFQGGWGAGSSLRAVETFQGPLGISAGKKRFDCTHPPRFQSDCPARMALPQLAIP
jgi:hypothetical protein